MSKQFIFFVCQLLMYTFSYTSQNDYMILHPSRYTVFILYFYCMPGQVYQMLHHRTAAGGGVVISVHFKLISIHIVNMGFSFPHVAHFGYGDELDCLPLL